MKNNHKNRKFKSLGIISPKVISGKLIENSSQKLIYDQLLELGFKETPWQYIYENQIGGLVYATTEENEIHVRFYHDRIFAEYERGRAYLAHFFGPRLNATGYLRDLLRSILPMVIFKDLEKFTTNNSLYKQELSYDIWIVGNTVDPINQNAKTVIRKVSKTMLKWASWRVMCFLLALVCSVSLLTTEITSVMIVPIILLISAVLILPKPHLND